MKKLSVLMLLLWGVTFSVWAADGICQRLTKDQFRAKQQAFLTEKAELTKEEAAKFFPLYFELQDRKQKLNDNAWKLLRGGKDKNITEKQYGEILNGVAESRVASSELEQTYLRKFQKILSNKKIYLIQRAEMRFHRELLKGMHGKNTNETGKKPSPHK